MFLSHYPPSCLLTSKINNIQNTHKFSAESSYYLYYIFFLYEFHIQPQYTWIYNSCPAKTSRLFSHSFIISPLRIFCTKWTHKVLLLSLSLYCWMNGERKARTFIFLHTTSRKHTLACTLQQTHFKTAWWGNFKRNQPRNMLLLPVTTTTKYSYYSRYSK